ncbi:MAG: thioredoxin domain-containing protein [Solirubrobacterales bacterium]|nr:thioredoxin domain-containing protein [Solirubrobacterales bacterium]
MSLSSKKAAEPGDADRLSGPAEAPPIILYADYECPQCGLAYSRLRAAGVNLGVRHFPVTSKHRLAWGAAAAAEAAALQGKFWEMSDSLFAEQGKLDPPHLWSRAHELKLDFDRFERDRTSDQTNARIDQQFRDAIRAGVAATPTLLIAGILSAEVPTAAEAAELARQTAR